MTAIQPQIRVTTPALVRAFAVVVLIVVIAALAVTIFGAPGSPLFDVDPHPQGSLFTLERTV